MNNKRFFFKSVVIVDDHPAVRIGLKSLLQSCFDAERFYEASSGAEARKLCHEIHPELALIDLSLPDMNGLDLVRDIRTSDSVMFILILSMFEESIYAERAISIGANGYAMKSSAPEVIVNAIERIIDGRIAVSDKAIDSIISGRSPVNLTNLDIVRSLSNRQLEIFERLAQGERTSNIAKSLHISVKTVETHIAHIKNRFGCDNIESLRSIAAFLLKRDP